MMLTGYFIFFLKKWALISGAVLYSLFLLLWLALVVEGSWNGWGWGYTFIVLNIFFLVSFVIYWKRGSSGISMGSRRRVNLI